MNFREMLEEIKKDYPAAKKIEVTYGGAGDSFDGFYDYSITEGEGDITHRFDDKYDELLNAAVEATGDSFTNDGSQGTIHIDLVNNKVWAEHYYNVMETVKDSDYDLNLDEETEE